MIKITVELLSAKNSNRNTILGIGTISNDGVTSLKTGGRKGSYKARFSKRAPKTTELWRQGKVENFDRENRGAWDLLYLALKDAVGDRNE